MTGIKLAIGQIASHFGFGATPKPVMSKKQEAVQTPAPDLVAEGTTSTPGIDPASSAIAIQKANEDLRAKMKAIGAGLGAIATSVLGVVGYTRADDIFPFPSHAPGGLGWLTAILAGVALISAALLVADFYAVQMPAQIGSNVDLDRFRNPFDVHAIHKEADRMRDELGATLYALDLRASRLARIAHNLDPEGNGADAKDALAHRARIESQRLSDTVRLELARLAGYLIRRRARRAFGGPMFYTLLGLAVLGTGWTFAMGDWAKGRRSQPEQKISQAYACIVRTQGLPDAADLVKACIAKAKADLSSTTNTTTTSAPPTTTTGK